VSEPVRQQRRASGWYWLKSLSAVTTVGSGLETNIQRIDYWRSQ
jgi:hypothetical protein